MTENNRPRNPAFASLATYPFVRLDQAKAEARARGVQVIDFTIGDPHEETPARIRERLLRSVPFRSSYPPAAGTPAQRAAIAGWIRKRFGVELNPDTHILPSNGSKEAVYLIHQAVIDPQGERRAILIPDPAYPVYEIAARFAGGEPVPVPLVPRTRVSPRPRSPPSGTPHAHGPDVDQLPEQPHGCSGPARVLPRRAETGPINTDSGWPRTRPIRRSTSTRPLRARSSSGLKGLLVFNTLSKRSAMTGYRSGFIAGDPEMIALLRKVRPSQGVATPSFVTEAACEAWEDEEHVADQRLIYREKRDVLLPMLRRKGIEIGGSEATFYLYLRVPAGETSESFARRLLDHGVAVVPANYFGASGEGWARMALVPTRQQCEEAAAILDRVL